MFYYTDILFGDNVFTVEIPGNNEESLALKFTKDEIY